MSLIFEKSRPFWAVMIILTALRLILAARLGLTPDEAYYWLWAKHLQPGYLDHPPMVAWFIYLGTQIFGDTTLGVRLLGPLSALAGSALLVCAGRDFFDDKTVGRKAAMLLNATLFLSLGAATMTPDTPLVFFISCALFALGRLIATQKAAWWIGVSASLALAFDSKYTAVLPAAACGIWWLAARRWKDALWIVASVVVGLLIIMPVLYWNGMHDWASFIKQGGRAQDWQIWRAPQFLGELLGGQIGLATPLVFIVCIFGVVVSARQAKRGNSVWLLVAMTLLPTFVFVQHAFGGRVQANWPVLIYPPAVLLGARLRRTEVATGLGFCITAVIYLQALTGWIPLSAHFDVVARQTGGWQAFSRSLEESEPGATVLIPDYARAAIIHFYAPHMHVVSLDPRWGYLNAPQDGGSRALLVEPERYRVAVPTGWRVAQEDGRCVCRFWRGRRVACYKATKINKSTREAVPAWRVR